jgi:hypothetical protein
VGNCVCRKEPFPFLETKNIKLRLLNPGLAKVPVSIAIALVLPNIIFPAPFGEYLEVMKGAAWPDSSDFAVRAALI